MDPSVGDATIGERIVGDQDKAEESNSTHSIYSIFTLDEYGQGGFHNVDF